MTGVQTHKETTSLNESLHAVFRISSHILDILLRFIGWKYEIVANVEKAF